MEPTKMNLRVFDGTDVRGWQEETKLKLMALNLWRIVQRKEKEPTDGQLLEAFEARKERAFAIISLSLSPTCRDCLRDLEEPDPHEAWNLIESNYNNPTPETKSALLKTLVKSKCYDDGQVAEHMSEFSDLVRRLHAMKVLIPEELLVVLLLEGLPETYENFSTLIMMGREEELKFEPVKEKLKHEAQSRMLKSENREDKVLVTRTKIKQGKCGCRHNHPLSECWKLHPEKAPRCSKCDKVGHIEKHCWGMKAGKEEMKTNYTCVEVNAEDYAF